MARIHSLSTLPRLRFQGVYRGKCHIGWSTLWRRGVAGNRAIDPRQLASRMHRLYSAQFLLQTLSQSTCFGQSSKLYPPLKHTKHVFQDNCYIPASPNCRRIYPKPMQHGWDWRNLKQAASRLSNVCLFPWGSINVDDHCLISQDVYSSLWSSLRDWLHHAKQRTPCKSNTTC